MPPSVGRSRLTCFILVKTSIFVISAMPEFDKKSYEEAQNLTPPGFLIVSVLNLYW